MIERRDMVLGISLIALILCVFIAALLLAVSVSSGSGGPYQKSVGLVEVEGPILSSGNVVDQLESYIENDNICAIVLRINSPGGGVTASQEIYETILLAHDAKKPVIASMGTVAASGGYYIAAACDTIMAMPSTLTGSIGVIANYFEIQDLLDKFGIKFEIVKSGKYKDIGTFTRSLTDDERELLQDVIMDIYDQFIEAIVAGRNMDESYIRQYSDGRVFTGRQAQRLGFVDLMGNERDAIDLAGDLAGIGADPPVFRNDEETLWDVVAEAKSGIAGRIVTMQVPRLMYLLSE